MDKHILLFRFCITLVAVGLFSRCAPGNPEIKEQNLPELLRVGFDLLEDEHHFEQIISGLNDSLSKTKLNDFLTLPHINYINEVVDWDIVKFGELPWGVPGYMVFELKITEDTILYDDKVISISDLENIAYDYIFDSDNDLRHLTHEIVETGDFGQIEVSRIAVHISILINGDKGLTTPELRLFYESLDALLKVYNNERNFLAIKKWGEDFNSLTFSQQCDLFDLIGYPIYFTFIQKHEN